MGIFDEYGALLPEEKREDFKSAVSAFDGAVKIDSREILDKLVDSNSFVKSWKDSIISKATASHDENFKANTLPGLIDEEIKKRGPKPKDPEVAALYDEVKALKEAKAQAERDVFIANQRSKVLPKITELGIDAELADILIGNSDVETDSRLDKFIKSVTKARDGYTEKVLKDRFGNMAPPPRGGDAPTTKEQMTAKYKELINAGKREEANRIFVAMQTMK